MTKAEYDSAKIIHRGSLKVDLAVPKFDGCQMCIQLYDENMKSKVYLQFYKNVFLRAKARAEKYPDLCPKISLFAKLFLR